MAIFCPFLPPPPFFFKQSYFVIVVGWPTMANSQAYTQTYLLPPPLPHWMGKKIGRAKVGKLVGKDKKQFNRWKKKKEKKQCKLLTTSHKQTHAQPFFKQRTLSKPNLCVFPSSASVFVSEHNIVCYGISLSSIQFTCFGVSLPRLLPTPSIFIGGAEREKEKARWCAGTVQQ